MDMIEKVARAIDPHAWEDGGYWNGRERTWRREKSLDAARAALEALREPTKEMWEAYIRWHGLDPYARCENIFDATVGVGALSKWQAMIDAALKENG